MNVLDLFLDFHDIPIRIYPVHKRLVGRATSTILFSYICRQLGHYHRDKFFATNPEVIEHTGLTLEELRGAKKHLQALGLVCVTREGGNGRNHYSLNTRVLRGMLDKMKSGMWGNPTSGCVKVPHPDVLKSHIPLREQPEQNIPSKDGRDVPAPSIPKSPSVEGESSKPPTSAKFQRVFIRLWGSHYNGQTYKFHGAKDGAAFKSMFAHFKGDKAKFKEVVRRYLDDESDFFRGHPAAMLNSQLNRFLAPTESEGPDIRVTTVEDDGSPINFD